MADEPSLIYSLPNLCRSPARWRESWSATGLRACGTPASDWTRRSVRTRRASAAMSRLCRPSAASSAIRRSLRQLVGARRPPPAEPADLVLCPLCPKWRADLAADRRGSLEAQSSRRPLLRTTLRDTKREQGPRALERLLCRHSSPRASRGRNAARVWSPGSRRRTGARRCHATAAASPGHRGAGATAVVARRAVWRSACRSQCMAHVVSGVRSAREHWRRISERRARGGRLAPVSIWLPFSPEPPAGALTMSSRPMGE